MVPLTKMQNKESAELAGAPLITIAHNLPAEGGFQSFLWWQGPGRWETLENYVLVTTLTYPLFNRNSV